MLLTSYLNKFIDTFRGNLTPLPQYRLVVRTNSAVYLTY